VAVEPITREQLDQFLPRRRAIGRFIGTEVEWLADPPGNVIGILAQRTGAQGWSYVILRRDQTGQYRFWDLQTRIAERAIARDRLGQVMAATQPQGSNCAVLVG